MRDAVMGSVTTGGMRMVNADIVRLLGISQFVIDTVAAEEQTRMQHSEERYREGWPALPIRDRTSLVVTDGIATGASMKAAVTALRKRGASRVVVCAPVASREGLDRVEAIADEVVCLDTPDPFISVTRWYEDASPPGDEECTALLKKSSLDLCRRPGRHTVH
jgi:putative phosphoribosyl transferase